MKLFSIITINYNNAEGLLDTLTSVKNQIFCDYEHIIIDGGSVDNSLNIIKSSTTTFAYWVSEKDEGVYNAQNKGIQQANGKYLIFLNSGDYFIDSNVLKDLAPYCEITDIVYGDILFKGVNTEHIYQYPDFLNFSFFLKNSLPHPCTAIKKCLFGLYGHYNEKLVIAADWVFFLDMVCKNNASYKHVNRVVSVFQTGGLSSDINAVANEKHNYLNKNYLSFYSEFLQLIRSKEKIENLYNSKLIKLVFYFLPKKYRNLLYNIEVKELKP